MQSETERLREQVKQLKGVLGIGEQQIADIQRTFPTMEPVVAQMLAMLLKREFVTRLGMYTSLYGARPDCDMPDEKVMDTQMWRLRRHLEVHDIAFETAVDAGWRMPKREKAKLRALMQQAPLLDLEAVALANDQRERRFAFLDGP